MNCPRCGSEIVPEYDDFFCHCPECGCEVENDNFASDRDIVRRDEDSSSAGESQGITQFLP